MTKKLDRQTFEAACEIFIGERLAILRENLVSEDRNPQLIEKMAIEIKTIEIFGEDISRDYTF